MPRSTHDPLSPAEVRAKRPGAKPIDVRDGLARGLILTILPSGRKTWSVRYRRDGHQRRLILGDFPSMSLARAREAAEGARVKVRDGEDPAAELQAKKRAPVDSFSKLADAYLERISNPKAREFKRSHAQDARSLKVDILPKWADRSVKSISREDVRSLIDGVAKRGAPIQANRTLALVRRVFNFALDEDEGWIDGNPASRIKKRGREVQRERVLTEDEIRVLWRLLSNHPGTADKPAPGRPSKRRRTDDPLCPISQALAAVQKVRLLTAQRSGEVVRMKWADVNLNTGWWMIPGSDTKNGREHRVWLSADALAIVHSQARDDAGLYVFAGHDGEALVHRAKKAPAALARVLGIEFRGHDLRRTAATKMAELGVPQADISRVLNHVENGPRATRIYTRYEGDREKQAALETWARELRRILADEPKSSTVVQHARRA
jgi:integrase